MFEFFVSYCMPAVRCAKFVHFEEKPELKDLNRAHLKKFVHTKFNLARNFTYLVLCRSKEVVK